jgi:chromosome segregation ATPase
MTMTLEQVRDWHLDRTNYVHLPITNKAHKEMADAIDAHLLSQDAEISNLRDDRDSWLDQASQRLEDWDDMRRRAESAESRLAAAKAEIEQLQAGLAKHVNRVCELQDRLAAANALLRECYGFMESQSIDQRSWGETLSLGEKIDAHLQGAQHDRAEPAG